MNKIFTLIAAAVLCCGCLVQSINPFYTDNTVIQLPRLLGSWDMVSKDFQDDKSVQIKSWVIDPKQILTFDEHGLCGPYRYKTFKIDEDLFLDVLPVDDPEGCVNAFWVMGVARFHLLFKLDINDEQLILTPLNYEWFQAKQKSGQLALAMVKATGEDWGFFNVPPQEWVDFLKQHKSEKDFFRNESKIILKRRSEK